jgi:hypothetical protein
MQTFFPHPNIFSSARCLDNKRLGKQRVEAKQLLLALGVSIGQHQGNTQSRWRNHPAARMWRGYEVSLVVYGLVMCFEWRRRGFQDTLKDQFQQALVQCLKDRPLCRRPYWIGSEAFHASHRSNLLRKDATYYAQFGWTEPDDLPYVWPTASSDPDADRSRNVIPRA